MALSPILVIGCGGSGGKVLVGIRKRLDQQLRLMGWNEGIPRAFQLVYVDTPTAQEVNLEFGPPVPQSDYISTSAGTSVYSVVDEALTLHATAQSQMERLVDWRPSPDLPLAVHLGAGQWRGVGRAVGFRSLGRVAHRIEQARGEFVAGQQQLQRLGELMGDPALPATVPFVVVVSSMAGGTGAGIFMDVCDVVRTVDPGWSDQIMSVLFTAEVFKNIGNAPGLQPNTVAAISELMAGYFDRNRTPETLYGGLVQAPAHQRGGSGPNYPFMVGMSTVNGTMLNDVGDCYRIVTETLVSAMTRPEVYNSLLQFQVGNWSVGTANHSTAWGFGQGVLDGGNPIPGGMVSSFGSARLAVGSELFGEYAVARLTREVVEFLVDDYMSLGREHLRDPQATEDQVLDWYRQSRGLSFVEACGLRELNIPGGPEHNQVIEALLPKSELSALTGTWFEGLRQELLKANRVDKSRWRELMQGVLPLRKPAYIEGVVNALNQNSATFVREIPNQITTEVSRVMFELGVPVARALVAYAKEHIDAARAELTAEALKHSGAVSRWMDAAMTRLSGLSDGDDVDANDERISGTQQNPGALRLAVQSFGIEDAKQLRAARAAEILRDLSNDVLGPLMVKLQQVAASIGGSEAREQWAKFPKGESVPVSFRPTPFDFCLIPASEWPDRYDRLRDETVRREQPEDRLEVGGTIQLKETVRRMIGGGGFKVSTSAGVVEDARSALVARAWERGRPAQFATELDVADVFARARLWAQRRATPIGDFISQDLDSYLSPTGADGQAVVDHPTRLKTFKDLLGNALQAATPLVAIDTNLVSKVHPQSKMTTLESVARPKIEPLPVSGPAREVAREVLEGFLRTTLSASSEGSEPDGPGAALASKLFTDGTRRSESVLIVSQLAGAVHPSVLTSVTQPIAAAWAAVKGNPASVKTFWQFRRGRTMPESIPVAPQVLDAMVKGWFAGRMLGIIPNPSATDGFTIGDLDSIGQPTMARFPWPLLRCGAAENTLVTQSRRLEWLPAILESLGLAFTLLPTEPRVLDAYNRLYRIGRDPSYIEQWIETGLSPTALGDSQVSGSTPAERHDAVITGLRGTIVIYEQLIAAPVVKDREHFYHLPFGRSLFPQILMSLKSLVDDTKPPVPDIGPVVG